MEISSSAFSNNELIPSKYTCDGQGVSPPLKWKNVPENTKSLVLIVDDPDAPMGTWTHWILYNLPPHVESLSENVEQGLEGADAEGLLPEGTKLGITSGKERRFGQPCPPSGEHRYFFKLYALDTVLSFERPAESDVLQKAMKGHILAQASLMGRYKRASK